MSIDSLNPIDRSCLLVGRFLQRWALMESQLRRAIGNALGLDQLQAVVVCANISLRDKINILKTAVNMSTGLPTDRKARYTKLLDNVATHSATRNMIAHDMFGPTDDGQGVSFFVVRAKGKFALPETNWDQRRFNHEYAAINRLRTELVDLARALNDAKLVDAMMQAWMQRPGEPNLGLPSLNPPGLLNRPPPEPPRSNPTASNPETEPQMPPTRRG